MKKQIVITAISLLLIITCLFAACNIENGSGSIFPQEQETSVTTDTDQTSIRIRELENRIIELQQNQYISDAEYEKELEALRAELALLKGIQGSDTSDTSGTDTDTDVTDTSAVEAPRFLYHTEDGKATITGYTGTDTHIVIPSSIDGFDVETIAENAFSSETLRSVIITNGIKKIDWFAFKNCTSLVAATIPSSVTSIGHSAFANTHKEFTVYCHSGSFAQSYAKSYGISHTII